MNKKLITENLKEFFKLCPLEKIQIFNESLIIVVKPEFLSKVLFFNGKYSL